MKLFSTEQVSKYHPDKYADQISDAILTECLRQDKNSRVACECMVKDTTVVLGGEITTLADVDFEKTVLRVADKLGYKVDKIINLIGRQSLEIGLAVDGLGAGDQGLMFGFATKETISYLPAGFETANNVIALVERDVANNKDSILKGDAKTQIVVDLDTNNPQLINISVCHKENVTLPTVREYVKNLLREYSDTEITVNPAGIWTVGGAIADCGLTGRKIVCDQYGGYVPVGGGAFSGKDPTKVDRSAAYMARYIAKYAVNNYDIKNCVVQIGYIIGEAEPVSLNVADNKLITEDIKLKFDLRPRAIIERLGLLDVDYEKLSEGCHFRAGWL